MMNETGVKLTDIIEEFKLEVLHAGTDMEECVVTTESVNRPGLSLSGFFEHFDDNRLQLIGRQETAYLTTLSGTERRERFAALFAHPIPAFIIARNGEPFPECLEMARQCDRTVLRTQESTSSLLSTLVVYLKDFLTPRITRHGVLVEVYGEGCLLMGESGVGKSETAVELLKRGHRLIADDAVEIRRSGTSRLVGNSPAIIRHYMELRGIGVIDVMRLFGMSAVRDEKYIDLVINLEQWDSTKAYDRLGIDRQFTELLGVNIPSITVPVRPGRNLAVIVEVAAMNNRDKRMGFNAAEELTERMSGIMTKVDRPYRTGGYRK
ncbi:MAG: HPr(Ser) kinase/phosphatase [Oscillospiraceae bacterium]|nr:HPr(Ser) kinase/phosphatase [Oscillospiraceae bacterium]